MELTKKYIQNEGLDEHIFNVPSIHLAIMGHIALKRASNRNIVTPSNTFFE